MLSLLVIDGSVFDRPLAITGTDMSIFGVILSKDAVFYLATDSVIAPLIEYIECDEVVGGRRQLTAEEEAQAVQSDAKYMLNAK